MAGANTGGEALAAGSEPGEAANTSSAKSGSFSSSAAGEGPGRGAGDGRCPHGTAPSPLLLPGDTSAGGQRDTGTVGVPGQSPTRQDTPRLSTGTKGTTPSDKRPLPAPQTPQPCSPNLGQFPTCSQPPKTPPGGTERPPRVPSPPGHSAGQSWPLGRAHLEAAAVPVVPGTFGLFLLLCGVKTGGQSLGGSRGSPQAVEQLPSPAALPGTGLWSAPSCRPRSTASQELGPARRHLRCVLGPARGWGHLPWCCRDFSPSWAWLCSSSRCGGRVLGKKTLSGHSSPAVYCTLSRFSASPLAVPAETEGSAWLGGHAARSLSCRGQRWHPHSHRKSWVMPASPG